jgi:hypothetical protein
MSTDTQNIEDPTPRINLSTSDDIRREMAKVYRETRFNKILPNNGTKWSICLQISSRRTNPAK